MYNTVVWGIFTEVCKHHNLIFEHFSSFQFSHSVVSDSATPWNQSTAGLSVHHQLLEFTQTHGHQVGDAIHPSHPLSSPSPLAPNPTQHQVWELDCEESWAPKNWSFWNVVLEKTLESPLDCKEIQSVHSEGDQPCGFFGRNDAKAETPVLWPPHAKSWLIGQDWCWEGLGAGGEGDDRGGDGWVASLTWWTWVCVNSGSWWWTGRPGVLRFMRSQRVGHDWVTELNAGFSDLPWWLSQ